MTDDYVDDRLVSRLYDLVRAQLEGGGVNAEQAARRALEQLGPAGADQILYGSAIAAANAIVSQLQRDPPAPRPAVEPAGRSTRWEHVRRLAANPKAWPCTTADGTETVLGELAADDLAELAELYEHDAQRAEAMAKSLRRLADALEGTYYGATVDALPDELVEEMFET